jgi:hypothetical protein
MRLARAPANGGGARHRNWGGGGKDSDARSQQGAGVLRCDADWRRGYVHLAMRRQKNIAKVDMDKKLAVRLYWMWRNGWEYSQLVEFGSYAGKLATGHGVN